MNFYPSVSPSRIGRLQWKAPPSDAGRCSRRCSSRPSSNQTIFRGCRACGCLNRINKTLMRIQSGLRRVSVMLGWVPCIAYERPFSGASNRGVNVVNWGESRLAAYRPETRRSAFGRIISSDDTGTARSWWLPACALLGWSNAVAAVDRSRPKWQLAPQILPFPTQFQKPENGRSAFMP